MKTKFKLGNIKIHNSMKPIVISECCDNHFGKIENAIKMVDLSKASGADIVKFQHHLPDEEMLPVVPKSSNFKGLKARSISCSSGENCSSVGFKFSFILSNIILSFVILSDQLIL